MYLEKLTDDQLQKVYDEINITKESLKRDVKHLIDWLEKQPHLPDLKDEKLLANFLIRCKNSLEKTKKKIDLYYSARAILSVAFTNRDPFDDTIKLLFYSVGLIPIPRLTPEGDRVLYFRVFDQERTDLVTAEEYLKWNFMIHDILLKDDISKKIICVWDMESVSLNFATNIIKAARKISLAIPKNKNPIPVRINKTILLNMTPKFNGLLNLCKNFLPKKSAEAIEIWGRDADLSEIMPSEMIPSNYGGKGKSLEQLRDEFYEYVLSFREWFKSQDEVKCDISKRNDDLCKEISLHGIDGSFRQLEVD